MEFLLCVAAGLGGRQSTATGVAGRCTACCGAGRVLRPLPACTTPSRTSRVHRCVPRCASCNQRDDSHELPTPFARNPRRNCGGVVAEDWPRVTTGSLQRTAAHHCASPSLTPHFVLLATAHSVCDARAWLHRRRRHPGGYGHETHAQGCVRGGNRVPGWPSVYRGRRHLLVATCHTPCAQHNISLLNSFPSLARGAGGCRCASDCSHAAHETDVPRHATLTHVTCTSVLGGVPHSTLCYCGSYLCGRGNPVSTRCNDGRRARSPLTYLQPRTTRLVCYTSQQRCEHGQRETYLRSLATTSAIVGLSLGSALQHRTMIDRNTPGVVGGNSDSRVRP